MSTICENYENIRKRIADAAARAGRDPGDVTLIAVTKLHEKEEMLEAITAGVRDIAENKVQEIMRKYDEVNSEKSADVRWHLIGHLQTNKVKYIIDKVSLIHSVDSVNLANEIDKQAKKRNIVADILIQVNTAREESKFGLDVDEIDSVIEKIKETCENVRIKGFMCMAPFEPNPENTREYFKMAKEIFDRYRSSDKEIECLSMGMSNDFEVAIEEGATMVRVGTAIFGERDYSKEIKTTDR